MKAGSEGLRSSLRLFAVKRHSLPWCWIGQRAVRDAAMQCLSGLVSRDEQGVRMLDGEFRRGMAGWLAID